MILCAPCSSNLDYYRRGEEQPGKGGKPGELSGKTGEGKGALYERQPDVPVRRRVRECRGRQGRPRRSEGDAQGARRWHLRRGCGHQERRRQSQDRRQDREADPAWWLGRHGGRRSFGPDLPSLHPGRWTIGGGSRRPDRPPGGGMSRSDVKEVGEMLDNSEAALIVVGEATVERAVDEATKRAKRDLKKEIRADARAMEKAVDEA